MSGTARALLDDLLNDFEAMGYGHRPVVERRIDAIIAAARADAAQQEVARLAEQWRDAGDKAWESGFPERADTLHQCSRELAALAPASPVAEGLTATITVRETQYATGGNAAQPVAEVVDRTHFMGDDCPGGHL